MLRIVEIARIWPLRGRAADAAIAVGTAVLVVAGTLPQLTDQTRAGRMLLGVGLIAAACAALYVRRRHPIAVAVFTLLACGAYYPFAEPDGPMLLTFVVGLYTVAMEGHLVAAIALATTAMGVLVLGELDDRHIDNTGLMLFAGWLVAVIAIGGVTRNRRAYLQEAERRALDAERTKEEEALRRATEERLRIARELHDVLGHHISLINVQASAALHRLRQDPAQAEDALGAIKQTSKDALRELRATLGVLRQVDETAPTAPAPSLARLSELVDRAGAMGLSVRTEVEGGPRPVPAEVDLAAYRIVQEALTNVSRHAGTANAVVRIRYGDDDVRVEIDDDGRGAANGAGTGGNGIRGMGERARALGGELFAGARPDGGFRVRARLPLGGVS
jgi:signal transduction histidine kinase